MEQVKNIVIEEVEIVDNDLEQVSEEALIELSNGKGDVNE